VKSEILKRLKQKAQIVEIIEALSLKKQVDKQEAGLLFKIEAGS